MCSSSPFQLQIFRFLDGNWFYIADESSKIFSLNNLWNMACPFIAKDMDEAE